MRLAELDPVFLRLGEMPGSFHRVPTLDEAQGVMFMCPTCFVKNGGDVGTHVIICWSRSRGVPDDGAPNGRWALVGTSLDDLTLTHDVGGDPGKPSVQINGGCAAHFHVRGGEVVGC